MSFLHLRAGLSSSSRFSINLLNTRISPGRSPLPPIWNHIRSFHPVLPSSTKPLPPPSTTLAARLKSTISPPPSAKLSSAASSPGAIGGSTVIGGSSSGGAAGSSTAGGGKKKSPHMVWYREIIPAMIPILLLSTTIFLTLSLMRTHLSHSKSLTESNERIAELEAELERLRRSQARLRERERKERERILPLVVERVLQKVGAVKQEDSEHAEGMLV